MKTPEVKFFIRLFIMLVIGILIIYITEGFDNPLKETTISYYANKYHGRKTANGEIYNMNELTAASPKLKFGTKVLIINPKNNKQVIVRINDRGPFAVDSNGKSIFPLSPHQTRGFDLSKAAFDSISKSSRGVIRVKYKILN